MAPCIEPSSVGSEHLLHSQEKHLKLDHTLEHYWYGTTCTEFPIPSFIEIFRLSFREFPRLVGRYCIYLLPKQGRGTPKTKHDEISRTMGWGTL